METWSQPVLMDYRISSMCRCASGCSVTIHADVDNFLQATYADPNDVEAEVRACTVRPGRAGRVGGESRLGRIRQPAAAVGFSACKRARCPMRKEAGTTLLPLQNLRRSRPAVLRNLHLL
jgi:hypothetical protein